MKILVLEDSPLRCEWFRASLIGVDIDFTDNPQTAIDLLTNNVYDCIYLDHDLLPLHYSVDTECDKTTGLCVAKWLAENKECNRGTKIVLHSRNPNGRTRMREALTEGWRYAEEIPFDKLSGLSL